MSKPILQAWTFGSDSNPAVQYETLRYTDGSTSCNCPGWTRRITPNGSRSCKHTRAIDMGVADQQATATHHYETSKPLNHHAQTSTTEKPRLGQRRFAV